ncbi:hypothetical protein GOP47_0006576 [Adiantum capillus-veneris]|uniref:Uncharacterized protein n=1 Tax=Adiantum capillus-veneris TaxID=13818 RepID=A0A9D4V3P8_ADICA|nr:hypothetical protein GOP47_0006576 [Adiantum capillus-veneris]
MLSPMSSSQRFIARAMLMMVGYFKEGGKSFCCRCKASARLDSEGCGRYIYDNNKYQFRYPPTKRQIEESTTAILASKRAFSEDQREAILKECGFGEIIDDILRHGSHDVIWCYLYERMVSIYVRVKTNHKEDELSLVNYHRRVAWMWDSESLFNRESQNFVGLDHKAQCGLPMYTSAWTKGDCHCTLQYAVVRAVDHALMQVKVAWIKEIETQYGDKRWKVVKEDEEWKTWWLCESSNKSWIVLKRRNIVAGGFIKECTNGWDPDLVEFLEAMIKKAKAATQTKQEIQSGSSRVVASENKDSLPNENGVRISSSSSKEKVRAPSYDDIFCPPKRKDRDPNKLYGKELLEKMHKEHHAIILDNYRTVRRWFRNFSMPADLRHNTKGKDEIIQIIRDNYDKIAVLSWEGAEYKWHVEDIYKWVVTSKQAKLKYKKSKEVFVKSESKSESKGGKHRPYNFT